VKKSAKRSKPRTKAQTSVRQAVPPYGSRVESEVVQRLAALEGHTRALRRLWSDRAPTHEFLQQVAAVRDAWDALARLIVLAHLEAAVQEGVRTRSSARTFAALETTLMRYLGWSARLLDASHRHAGGGRAGERHRHLHRHPDGTVHSHEHAHDDHWHPILGTLVEPPLHEH
jgi:DNA-binding FrmR family transcriptional regulator